MKLNYFIFILFVSVYACDSSGQNSDNAAYISINKAEYISVEDSLLFSIRQDSIETSELIKENDSLLKEVELVLDSLNAVLKVSANNILAQKTKARYEVMRDDAIEIQSILDGIKTRDEAIRSVILNTEKE